MTKPHVLQTCRYPDWDQGPLDEAFTMHRYFEAGDKAAFLAAAGPQVRAIATAKELELRGSFRFHAEFAIGVGLMQKGLIDVKPLITHTLPLGRAEDAFRLASDRTQAMKAQIRFS